MNPQTPPRAALGDLDMTEPTTAVDQPIGAGGQPISEAPDWVQAIITPPAELTPVREHVLHWLAGKPSDQVRPLGNVDMLFSDAIGDRGVA
jgi:hypothetical protein